MKAKKAVGVAHVLIWLAWFWLGLAVIVTGKVSTAGYAVLWAWMLYVDGERMWLRAKDIKEDNEDEREI